jgi:hypothetical protein
MRWFSNLGLGTLTALCSLAATGVVILVSGQQMFSPGPLSARGRNNVALSGVTSHAQIGSNCSACHAPAWSGETMADRCLVCHTNIREQIEGRLPMHGLLADGMDCRKCHTEHKGHHAALTSFEHFDHDCTRFKLTGMHVYVECSACHKDERYQGTPQTCVSCHAEPLVHKGKYGKDCASCHNTATWAGSEFRHNFPVNHAKAMQKGGCAICHSTPNDFKTYTCSNCHRHDEEKTKTKHLKDGVTDVSNCAHCHPSGRKKAPRVLDDVTMPWICQEQPESPWFVHDRGHLLPGPVDWKALTYAVEADDVLWKSVLSEFAGKERKKTPDRALLSSDGRTTREQWGSRLDQFISPVQLANRGR